MARSSATVTDSELAAIQQWAAANNVIWDGSDLAAENGRLLRANFIEGNWLTDITQASLDQYHDALKPHLKYYTEDQKRFLNAWSQATDTEKAVFAKYWSVDRQVLANDWNYSLILGWIKGKDMTVSDASISRAVEMLIDKLQWRYSSKFKSRLSDEEKANHKPGSFISDANKTPKQYKDEMESAYAANRGDKTSAANAETNEARREAEALQGRTHGDTARIKARLVANKDGSINWSETLRLRKMELASQEKARQLVRR
jgi:hypothetical protein